MSFASALVNTLMRGIGGRKPKSSSFAGPEGYSVIPLNPRVNEQQRSADGDPRVMALPIGDGKYAERVVGEGGRIEGFGDQRDYEPLAVSPRPTPELGDPTLVPTLKTPPSEYERLVSLGRRLSQDKSLDEKGNVIKKPGRLKAGLMNALGNIGQQAQRNLETGRTNWTDLAGVAGAGAGGFGVGAAKPDIFVKARHQKAVEANREAQQEELARMGGLAKIKGIQAEAARDQAYADDLKNKPERDRIEAAQKKAKEDAALLKQKLDIKGDDPYDANDPNDVALFQQARAAGLPVKPDGKGNRSAAKGDFKYTNPVTGDLEILRPNAEGGYDTVLTRQGGKQVESLDTNDDDIRKAEAEQQSLKDYISEQEQAVKDYEDQLKKNYESRGKMLSEIDDSEKDAEGTVIKQKTKANPEYLRSIDAAKDLEKKRDDGIKAVKEARRKLGEIIVPNRRKSASVTPRAVPQRDGKYHYTMSQIQSAAEEAGRSVDEIVAALKKNPKVVIEN